MPSFFFAFFATAEYFRRAALYFRERRAMSGHAPCLRAR